ncbi:MAG: hypothetical protein ACE149_04515 [Armatimonadota bacterium]
MKAMAASTGLQRLVFPPGASERVEVWTEPSPGQPVVHARIHSRDDDGAWRPTEQGLSLSPEVAFEVARAMLTKAREARGETA